MFTHFYSDGHPDASNLLLQWTSLCLSPYEPGLKFLWDASLEWITGSYSFLVSTPRLFSTMAVPVCTAISHVQEHSSSYNSLIAGLPQIFTNLLKIKTWASLYILANSDLIFSELPSFIHILYWDSHLFLWICEFLVYFRCWLLAVLVILIIFFQFVTYLITLSIIPFIEWKFLTLILSSPSIYFSYELYIWVFIRVRVLFTSRLWEYLLTHFSISVTKSNPKETETM